MCRVVKNGGRTEEEGEKTKDSRITIATYQDSRILSLLGRPKWIKLILFKDNTWSFRYSHPHCWEVIPIRAGGRGLTMAQHPRPEEINICSVISTSAIKNVVWSKTDLSIRNKLLRCDI